MTFKHIFNSGSIAILKVEEVSFNEASEDIVSYFSTLRDQDDRFSDKELQAWFCHILDWCMENLE